MAQPVTLGAPFEHAQRWHAHQLHPSSSQVRCPLVSTLSLTLQLHDGTRYDDISAHVDPQADWSPRQTAARLPIPPALQPKHQTLADAVAFSASPNQPAAVPSFPQWRRDSFVTSELSYASPPSGGSRRHSSPGASSATSPGAHARHSRVSSFDSAAGPPSPGDDELVPATPEAPAPPLLQVPPSSGKFRPIPKRKPGATRTLTEGDRRAICLYARDHPEEKQQAMASYFGVDRTTISKTLKVRRRLCSPS